MRALRAGDAEMYSVHSLAIQGAISADGWMRVRVGAMTISVAPHHASKRFNTGGSRGLCRIYPPKKH